MDIRTSTMMDMRYNYTAGQNNGRITQSVDAVLNETVNYTYDALNRLATAQATNNSWGNAYSYDGFGNLTGATVIAGSAPSFSANIDPATNRYVAPWSGYYDANGNPGYYLNENPYGTIYDVENRLVNWTGPTSYDPAGKRITLTNSYVDGGATMIYFYGITGQRLGTYTLVPGTGFSTISLNLYFGSKLMRAAGSTVATDRLGSVRADATEQMRYWPYGQERTSTPDNREKFATYFRDTGTSSDYANQRYYSFGSGRFQTPDPAGMSAVNPKNPTSWNRYAYVNDDPINHNDPIGLEDDLVDDSGDSGGGGGGGGDVNIPVDDVTGQPFVPSFSTTSSACAPDSTSGGCLINSVAGLVTSMNPGGFINAVAIPTLGGPIVGSMLGAVLGTAGVAGATAQPVSVLYGDIQASFDFGASVQPTITQQISGLSQVYSTAAPASNWVTTEAITSSQQAISTLALPPWNLATAIASATINAGSTIVTGTAAPLFGQPGGGYQIYVQPIANAVCIVFGSGCPVP